MVETQWGQNGGNIGWGVQGQFTGVKLGPWLLFAQDIFLHQHKSPVLVPAAVQPRPVL